MMKRYTDLPSTLGFWLNLFREMGIYLDNPKGLFFLPQGNPYCFGRLRELRIMWGCKIQALLCMVWLERRNKRIFEDYVRVGLMEMWDRIPVFVSPLGVCVS